MAFQGANNHREQAIQLRLAGFSRSQIAKALGVRTGGEALNRWLKDIPPPEWTQRPRSKDEFQAHAIELRKQGLSYNEIQRKIPVSKSTLSRWLRDLPMNDEQRQILESHKASSNERRIAAFRATHARRRARTSEEARAQIESVSTDQLFIAGVVAYMAEGSKEKPWSRGVLMQFMNSDPRMILFFLRWLDLVGVRRGDLKFRLSIHESADIQSALNYWSELVGVSGSDFQKTSLKRHNPKTRRRNVAEEYRGCLIVGVRKSTSFNRRISGWFEGIIANL